MSDAKPMPPAARHAAYRAQWTHQQEYFYPHAMSTMTPRQARRYRHKLNRWYKLAGVT